MEKPKLNFTINGAQNMDVLVGPQSVFKEQDVRLLNGGDVFTVVADNANLLFQNVKTPFGMISLSMYDIVHESEMSARAPDSSVEFMFMMRGNASFKMEGLERIDMGQHDCNLIYYPFVENRVRFPAGSRITTIDLHLDPGYLVELLPYFKGLGTFLEKVYKNEAVGLFDAPISIPTEVVSIIAKLFTKTKTHEGQELFLKTKVLEWVALPIGSPIVPDRIKVKLTKADKANIIGVYEAMLQSPDNKLTIEDMAKSACMSTFKFQYGHKALFHKPPHGLLVAERMKKAMELLADINNSVTDIAYMVGYQDISGFSRAFKNFHGYPPSFFRPNSKNTLLPQASYYTIIALPERASLSKKL